MSEAFKKVIPFLEKKRKLGHLLGIISFDVETIAPEKGIEAQNDLLNEYGAEYAAIAQDPAYIEAVKAAKEEGGLNEAQNLLIEDALEQIEFMSKIDMDTYIRWSKVSAKCGEVWKKAKNASSWEMVKPYFAALVEAKKEEAKLLHKPFHKTAYDAFLDQYEKGQTQEDIDRVFTPLKRFLIENIPLVLEKQSKLDMPKILPHDKDSQAHLSIGLLKAIGYDLSRGAIAETEHPFSNDIARNDCRVTTHYYESDWRSSMYSVIHEGGHSIQFQGWGDYHYDNYVEGRASAALCETHSRFYENLIGRSKAFAPILLGLCKEHLKGEFLTMSEEQFYNTVNEVSRGLIRTESDEFTYCLHIIIRYELERDLINGLIDVDHIKDAWNQKYKEYLGVEVPDDAHGILQDVHWFSGSFGYFPSYALGNMYGVQIMAKMKESLPVDKLLKEGDVEPIRAYLASNDFAFDYLNPKEWIKKVSGEEMNPSYYVSYLKEKFID